MAPIQTSVDEFIRSGRLSNGAIFLQHEDEAESHAHSESQPRRIMGNAVRVALLFTKSFVRSFYHPESIVGYDANWISLANFIVEFEEIRGEDEEAEGLDSNADSPGGDILLLGVQDCSPDKIKYEQDLQKQQQPPKAHSQASAIQILGGLLYTIFTQGEAFSALPDRSAISPEPSVDGIDSSSSMSSRSAKSSRVSETTLFSQLLERNTFPLSICRFMSDMIDTSSRGNAGKSFESFNEIIEALDQMISQPNIFLHDSYSPYGVPPSPMFGHNLCGRKEEVATLIEVANKMEKLASNSNNCDRDSSKSKLGAVFISGPAGSGKSRLVQPLIDYASSQSAGWIFTKAKFKRGRSYASSGIVSVMFDEVVSHVVKMKEGGKPDQVAYFERVTRSILTTIGKDELHGLVPFLPSLRMLFSDIDWEQHENTQMHTGWQLIYSVTKIIESVIDKGQLIVICCDDLQWAEKSSLQLVGEVLINLGNSKGIGCHCFFVGLYRSDEVDDDHPLSIPLSLLQLSHGVNFTEIMLSSLSHTDVAEMLMVELKLPRRFVDELANVVRKKTSGHALYVVELLHSLFNESFIAYNTRKYRYCWDIDRVDFIRTGDNVAEFISNNLSSLTLESQFVLKVLSCFGIQTDISLLEVLEQFQKGMIASLKDFFDKGILDQAGPILIFTHDLIQQAVYEGMSLDMRRSLHLQIGEYLGEMVTMEVISSAKSTESGMGQSQQAFYTGNLRTSSLITLACDQINSVGFDSVGDENQRMIFSKWNLIAGQEMANESNFTAALYYLTNGISFLARDSWLIDSQLCSSLYNDTVKAAFALGQHNTVVKFADELIDHEERVEDTLEIQQIVLRSLLGQEKYEECAVKGLDVLGKLNIEISNSPTDEIAMREIANTDIIASRYNIDGIVNLCHRASDDVSHGVLKIISAVAGTLFVLGSPLYSLLICESIQYSLQHGVYPVTARSFAAYSMLKIMNESDYEAGKRLADVSRAIIKHYEGAEKANLDEIISSLYLLYVFVDIWFHPLRDIAPKLMNISREAFKIGSIDNTVFSMSDGWAFGLYGGENLLIISFSSLQHLQQMARHNQIAAKWAVMDCVLLMELTGKSQDYFSVLGDSISNTDELEAEAKSSGDLMLLKGIHETNLMRSYWKADYISAEHHFHNASLIPVKCGAHTCTIILRVFFGCLVSFKLYRKLGGSDRLKEGIKMLNQMEQWSQVSPSVFGNKRLLLKAEYLATINEKDPAERSYIQSINASRDHGNICDLGLAYELLGVYYSSQGSNEYSTHCLTQAHVFYRQWGAIAVAERLVQLGLDLESSLGADLNIGIGSKNAMRRGWDGI